MYVILVNDDNTMYATQRERIMQRSKLVDNLRFIVNQDYKGYDMSYCTVLMEYLLPVSKEYHSEILTLSDERYNDYLQYVVPFDTNLTAEAGKVEIQLTFIYSDLDESGNSIQRVRKISATSIEIIPISAWSDIIPDSALTALDQRIIKLDAQIKELNDTSAAIYDSKADDLDYNADTNELQLVSGNKMIGKRVALKNCNVDEEGIPVVDFSDFMDDDFEEDTNSTDVVLF